MMRAKLDLAVPARSMGPNAAGWCFERGVLLRGEAGPTREKLLTAELQATAKPAQCRISASDSRCDA